ncbi:MAG: T9SS type A sorting domain-containing protein, partial [Breznakibacter sp.]|nr:T9SS type A sorting domain-containing protein [Breznakibacter sp.]
VALEGALVKIGLVEATTNASGVAILKGVMDGAQTLTISKVGYNTLTESITISSDQTLSKTLSISTSISSSQFNNLVVKPTISDGYITVVNLDIPVPFNWSVYAIDGTIVEEGVIVKKGDSIVDLRSTSEGVYILKFWGSDKIETRKLMIKR